MLPLPEKNICGFGGNEAACLGIPSDGLFHALEFFVCEFAGGRRCHLRERRIPAMVNLSSPLCLAFSSMC